LNLLEAPPHILGPVWQKYEDGRWYLPKKTLGVQVLAWMMTYLRMPGGELAGEPFRPTAEQCRFIMWWYAVDDEGKWVYSSGVLRRLKGWGKDPLAAALALAELCGPVMFSHFNENGNPVGKQRYAAWISVAAVSQEQTKNTFGLFPVMVSKELKQEFKLDINKFLIYSEAGGRLEAVTSNPASMEGNRPTFIIQNEIQNWTETEGGPAMANVIEGNLTKIPGARKLSICNAHIPGQDSVGERYWDNYQKILNGDDPDDGTLYDSIEAPPDTPGPVEVIQLYKDAVDEDYSAYEEAVEKLRVGITVAAGDAHWLPIDEIVKAVLNRNNLPTESRRKFYNQVNAAEDAWIAPWDWDAVEDKTLALKPRDRICLGFDGSKSNDHSALAACRVEDGAVFLIKAWNPADQPNGEVPREEVDRFVDKMFSTYDVVGFRSDVKEFEAYVDIWSRKYRRNLKVNASPNNPISFDMRGQTKRFSLDCEDFLDNVLAGSDPSVDTKPLTHTGDRALRKYVLNAHAYLTTYDTISIQKASKDSPRKIDGAVSAVLAWGSRKDYLLSKKARTGKAVVLR
jgi:hypothetical protein